MMFPNHSKQGLFNVQNTAKSNIHETYWNYFGILSA